MRVRSDGNGFYLSRYAQGKWLLCLTLSIIAWIFLTHQMCAAKPTNSSQAKTVAQNWLRLDPQPLGAQMGNQVREVRTVCDKDGVELFHVVSFNPSGFAIIAADDLLEPVICFVAGGRYHPSETNPLTAMVTKDMARRIEIARELQTELSVEDPEGVPESVFERSRRKWILLQRGFDLDEQLAFSRVDAVSNPRVAPFVSSKWSQGNEGYDYCYNYYTPYHSVCGCTATALSQLLRYHQHPLSPVGRKRFQISINGRISYAYTRGGDGSGGAYRWAQMTLDPDFNASTVERQSIGALTYDAGLTINTSYTSTASGGSLWAARQSLTSFFRYSNARYVSSMNGIPPGELYRTINPNLDAKLPVLLGVARTGGAHALLADGYGYNLSSIYHHLNLGWNGADDAWYHLPDIPTTRYHYSLVRDVVFNVYRTGNGEIISGQVTSSIGKPLQGVTVRTRKNGLLIRSAVTDKYGVYALPGLPSKSSLFLTPRKPGYTFESRILNTGQTNDFQSRSGNLWAVNFSAKPQ